MRLLIQNPETMEARWRGSEDNRFYSWATGNWACDCNRGMLFGDDTGCGSNWKILDFIGEWDFEHHEEWLKELPKERLLAKLNYEEDYYD